MEKEDLIKAVLAAQDLGLPKDNLTFYRNVTEDGVNVVGVDEKGVVRIMMSLGQYERLPNSGS